MTCRSACEPSDFDHHGSGWTECQHHHHGICASESGSDQDSNHENSHHGSPMLEIHRGTSVRVQVKVLVPVADHPNYNFIGKLLGPKGNSFKWLQEQTQTKMAILGRGSMRDKLKEEDLRQNGDPKYGHLREELHVEVTAFAPAAIAYKRISHALAEVQRFLVPDYYDEIRQQQLRELGVLTPNQLGNSETPNANATLAGNCPLSSNCPISSLVGTSCPGSPTRGPLAQMAQCPSQYGEGGLRKASGPGTQCPSQYGGDSGLHKSLGPVGQCPSQYGGDSGHHKPIGSVAPPRLHAHHSHPAHGHHSSSHLHQQQHHHHHHHHHPYRGLRNKTAQLSGIISR
ncbi:KH domain-containing, RNA-binding, signal transduction-associated protein 2 [Halotydeus destructor]|nr:KH domain-containing, RNA-binding, signal transduction-associated protein 2 [Halotydeus destructor]